METCASASQRSVAANRLTRGQVLAMLASIVATPRPGSAQTISPPRRAAIICEPLDGATAGDVSRFQSRLGGALLKTGHFSLVDRDRLDRVIAEQGFSNSAYADPHAAARLGKLVGAERILNVQLSAKMEADRGAFLVTVACQVSAEFSLVNVSTGQIETSGSADGGAQEKLSAGTGNVSPIELDALRRQAIDGCIDDLVQQLTA